MCVKCVVDSGHDTAAAIMLITEHRESWGPAIEELFRLDSQGKPLHHLTDEEHQRIVDLSQKFCDWADEIQKWIKHGAETIRAVGITHSFPNEHCRPKSD